MNENDKQNTVHSEGTNTVTTNKPNTSECGQTVNILPKRQKTNDDLYDAFMEISDIMTWNQLQPITEPNQLLHHTDTEEPIFAEMSAREDNDNYNSSENETVDSVNIVHII